MQEAHEGGYAVLFRTRSPTFGRARVACSRRRKRSTPGAATAMHQSGPGSPRNTNSLRPSSESNKNPPDLRDAVQAGLYHRAERQRQERPRKVGPRAGPAGGHGDEFTRVLTRNGPQRPRPKRPHGHSSDGEIFKPTKKTECPTAGGRMSGKAEEPEPAPAPPGPRTGCNQARADVRPGPIGHVPRCRPSPATTAPRGPAPRSGRSS